MAEEIEEYDQERVDALIWKNIGKKPVSEIARMAGIRPEKVMSRKNEMMNEIDVLTIEQKRQKLLVDLQLIAQKAQDDYQASPWETKAGLLNSAITAMKHVFTELNRSQKADQDKVQALNALRKKEIINLYIAVVNSGVSEIASKFDLPEDELFAIFNDKMRQESDRLDP